MDARHVQFTLTEEDLRAFVRRVVWRSAAFRATIASLIVLAIGFGLTALRNLHRPAPFVVLMLAFGFIAWWLARSDARQIGMLRRTRDVRLHLAPRTLTLSREGVGDATHFGRSFYEWHAVEAIDEAPRFAALMLSGIRGFVVPRRVFATEGDYVRFIETAKRLKREADQRAADPQAVADAP